MSGLVFAKKDHSLLEFDAPGDAVVGLGIGQDWKALLLVSLAPLAGFESQKFQADFSGSCTRWISWQRPPASIFSTRPWSCIFWVATLKGWGRWVRKRSRIISRFMPMTESTGPVMPASLI